MAKAWAAIVKKEKKQQRSQHKMTMKLSLFIKLFIQHDWIVIRGVRITAAALDGVLNLKRSKRHNHSMPSFTTPDNPLLVLVCLMPPPSFIPCISKKCFLTLQLERN